jgi:hypothetical protein
MVVFQIYFARVAFLEAEGHSPVGSYGNGPHAFAASLQWVQSKRRLVHILRLSGLIERGKDQPQAVELIGANPTAVVLLKQVPQTLVFETPDQYCIVKRQLTFVKSGQRSSARSAVLALTSTT